MDIPVIPLTYSDQEEEDKLDGLEQSSPFLNPDDVIVKASAQQTPIVIKTSPSTTKCVKCFCVTVVVLNVLAIVFVAGLLVGNFAIPKQNTGGSSSAANCLTQQDEICTNPPVLLISMDGFWNGYFEKFPENTSFFRTIASEGVQAQYMRSAFPTKTFPNHFSIVTGLYPESHGIVGNSFYDKELGQNFHIGVNNQNDPQWWLGEPVWVTAVKNGLLSGVYFWPGSEVEIEGIRPTYYYPYSWSVPFETRVNTVLSWLDLPKKSRPQFMAVYFNEPDHSSHEGGPDSAVVGAALGRVEKTIESLFEGMEERGISDCVNVIFTSDHGMAAYNSSRFVNIDDLVPSQYSSYVNYPTRGTIAQMNIINGGDLDSVYEAVVQNGTDSEIQVYLEDDLPMRLHVAHFNKQRYGDIYIIGNLGAYISSSSGVSAGQHGYDNNNEHMQAIFLAHGPAFKKDYISEPFNNIELYNLMCALLGIPASANNGTVGSLYHLLRPDVVAKLPPAVAPGGTSGLLEECPFPDSEQTYQSRAFCTNCICNSTNEVNIDEANRGLNLTTEMAIEYQQMHLPWGIPHGGEGNGSCILANPDYITLYSKTLHIPLWVAYRLTTEQVQDSVDVDYYRRDPRVDPTASANCSDYEPTTGYIETQMAPSGIMDVNPLSAFLLTNIVPQRVEFYKALWSPLNQIVRQWAIMYGTVYVISGVVLDADHNGMRDADDQYNRWTNGIEGGVAIPTHYYLIVTHCPSGYLSNCDLSGMEAIGITLPHTTTPPKIPDFKTFVEMRLSTIRDIEGFTGVNFFPGLSADDQNFIELKIVPRLWPVN